MNNYVVVLVLCGFSIRTYLSQDNQAYTFYPSRPSEIRPLVTEGQYGPQTFDRGQRQDVLNGYQPPQARRLNTPIRRQIELEAQPRLGTFRVLGTDQNANETAQNVVKVTYFSSDQQDSEPFQVDTNNFGDIAQIIKQIIGPQSEIFIQNAPPLGNSQLERVQRPDNQYEVKQGYFPPPSEQRSEDTSNTRHTFRQEQPSFAVQNTEYIEPRDQGSHRITNDQYQIVPNIGSGYERYSVRQETNSVQRPYPPTNEGVLNEPKPQYVYPISEPSQGITGEHQREGLNYQALSAFGNLQNSSGQIVQPSTSTKKPVYINRFAADLYITKKPCEICCKMGEIKPCSGCCNVTALLNSRTLKTAVG